MIMFKQRRLTALSIAVLLALLIAAVMPFTVLADDVTPPPAAPDTPVVVDPPVDGAVPPQLETAPPADEALTTTADAPVVDVPVADASATEEAASPVVDMLGVDVSTTEEPQTVSEILDASPTDTDLVVLDENEQPLALASQAAATTLLTGDPMWCPAGSTPADGVGGGCTIDHPSFSALIADLETHKATYSGAGTIYIAYDYDSVTAGDAGADIVFDYSLVDLYGSLVLQGGWDFTANTITNTPTTIAKTNLTFSDWGDTDGGTLTFNNLLIDGGFLSIGDPETFTTEADITLNNVTVTTSDPESLADSGIVINTTGDITLNNVNAFDNKLIGVMAQTTNGDVTVNGGEFENNGMIGLGTVSYTGDVTLNNVTATGSMLWGAIGEAGDTLTINGGQFNNNGSLGLVGGSSHGDVILNDVTATGNGTIGAMLYAAGDVTVNRGTFSNNVSTGLGVQNGGNVTLNNVIATGDTASGAGVITEGNISVVCGNYNGLILMTVDHDIYLGGPTVTGSGLNMLAGSGAVTYGECPKPVVDDKKDQPGEAGDGKNIIPLTSEAPICDGEEKVTLKVGDAFGVYEKLCGFEFQLTEADVLPGALPSGATQLASLEAKVTSGGSDLVELPSGGKIMLKFPIPAGTDASTLVVVFWNGSTWVEVSGGSVIDGYYVVTVEKPGTYVLVTQ
jgi:hypothetical protein